MNIEDKENELIKEHERIHRSPNMEWTVRFHKLDIIEAKLEILRELKSYISFLEKNFKY